MAVLLYVYVVLLPAARPLSLTFSHTAKACPLGIWPLPWPLSHQWEASSSVTIPDKFPIFFSWTISSSVLANVPHLELPAHVPSALFVRVSLLLFSPSEPSQALSWVHRECCSSASTFRTLTISCRTADALGRRYAMIAECVIFCVGVIIQISSTHVWQQFAMGRFVAGLGVGALSAAVPMYQAEAAPSQIRGTLTATYQLFITFGILVACEYDQYLSMCASPLTYSARLYFHRRSFDRRRRFLAHCRWYFLRMARHPVLRYPLHARVASLAHSSWALR